MRSGIYRGGHHGDAWDLALDRVEVVDSKSISAAVSRPAAHAAHVLGAGADKQKIRADAFNLSLNRRRCALANADHGNHRGHADDDAEHC